MHELPTHFPMPINADGDGPETDKTLVVKTICWNCIEEEWPCVGSLESPPVIAKTPRLVFFSSTSENTARFIAKLELDALRLPLTTGADTPLVNEPFILVTPTYGGDGDKNAIPKQVKKFLNVESNRALLRGVIGAGNTNFGHEYCRAADLIAAKCGVPHIYKFELMGMREDVANVRQGLEEFWS